jgi:hypothetical protein
MSSSIDYKIAIPSYKREKTIQSKTLSVLERHGIDARKIQVFVNDQEEGEYEKYRKSLDGNDYSKGIEIVRGVPTIGKQRNFIEKYYDEGTCLMMFDDDIEEVQRKEGKKLVPVDNLEEELIIRGFEECQKNNAKTFGIYASSNPFFMSHRVYTKLCYIIASTFGVICEKDTFLERITNHGEDYEYSIRQYIKNGAVVRLDDITVKSNYYKEVGGLQEIRTKEYVHDSIKIIADKFPDYCTMYIRKTTGNAELRLKDKTLKKAPKKGNAMTIEQMRKANTQSEKLNANSNFKH